MVTTLAINPGSSSKKYALFQNSVEVFSARFERTSEGFGKYVTVHGMHNRCESVPDTAYSQGLAECLKIARTAKIISDAHEIEQVGVRIVAPHSFFTTHRSIDTRFMNILESLKGTAPLHVPYLLEEIRAAEELLPHARLMGISDSAYHTTMPAHASLYSVPEEDRETYNLYRYGYHGLSVSSVVQRVEALHGSFPQRLIVIHVGSGVSVTAVKDGRSIDTTMGFSPASGLIMGSRGGDIDAGALLHLERAKGLSQGGIETYLNTMTGLRGLIGTADLRVVIDRAERGEYKAQRALHAFLYGIHKAMHAFHGVLGGVDAVVLTATAIERNATVRTMVMDAFTYLGATIDEGENEKLYERAGKISADGSSVSVYVIPTKEMAEIAALTGSLISR
jgi:acetate kinase